MPAPPDNGSEGIVFSGCLSASFFRFFVRSSSQILLRYDTIRYRPIYVRSKAGQVSLAHGSETKKEGKTE